ncbi:MAG TPA: hypothetical protein PKW80_07135 [Bacteroidales bacterium]|nr:hypothetical protein [Bacteroidales bacterium]
MKVFIIKKIKCYLLLVFFVISAIKINAQTPEKFNYQTVVRDNSGNIVANQPVSFRISILQGSVSGDAVYVETQKDTTNTFGLSVLKIGDGTPLAGTMAAISWANNTYFIKVELDQSGGSSFVLMGITQLISVPYAFHSKTADSITGTLHEADPVFDASVARSITNTDTACWNNKLDSSDLEMPKNVVSGDIAYFNGTSWVAVPIGLPGQYLQVSQSYTPTWAGTLFASLITTAASSVQYNTATSGGNITSSGGSTVTARGICYHTAPNPTIANSIIASGSGTGTFTANMTGLVPNTTYYVRAYATNAVGTAYGNEVNFTTIPAVVPALSTANMTSVDGSSAISGGDISSSGGYPVTARGVCWSTNPNPTIADNITSNGSGTGTFTSTITGLIPNTLYYLRAYATNSVGTAYGNEVIFTTLVCILPTLTTISMSAIGGISAKCGGNISSSGNCSPARGVCWSTNPNPTIADSITSDGTGTGSYTSTLTGLTPHTVYYVRAYATNLVGTNYGNEISFNSGYVFGEDYAGGLVFYNDGAEHGLVCANTDQGTSSPWGCYGTIISGANATAIGTGNQNTIDIITGCTTAGIAAKLCFDLVSGGFDDWFLPSKDELNQMYLNLKVLGLGGFANSYYWSSSEITGSQEANQAWPQSFSHGGQYNNYKNLLYYVRAVRAF